MFPFFIFSVFEMHDLIEMKDKEESSFLTPYISHSYI